MTVKDQIQEAIKVAEKISDQISVGLIGSLNRAIRNIDNYYFKDDSYFKSVALLELKHSKGFAEKISGKEGQSILEIINKVIDTIDH